MRQCEMRDRIRAYTKDNPGATIRKIMAECGASSTSHVVHHLKKLEYEDFDRDQLIAENKALRKQVDRLQTQVLAVKKAIE
mgnify:CR=1 FL=1